MVGDSASREESGEGGEDVRMVKKGKVQKFEWTLDIMHHCSVSAEGVQKNVGQCFVFKSLFCFGVNIARLAARNTNIVCMTQVVHKSPLYES